MSTMNKKKLLRKAAKFYVRERGERVCRNPQTGEEFIAPPTKKVKFKAFGNVTNYNFKYGR